MGFDCLIATELLRGDSLPFTIKFPRVPGRLHSHYDETVYFSTVYFTEPLLTRMMNICNTSFEISN